MQATETFCIVYATVPSKKAATSIASSVIKERLAACANILGPTDSVYRWKDDLEKTKEYIVLMKTTQKRWPALKKKILSLHKFECPCIINIPISDAHEPYLKWISGSVG